MRKADGLYYQAGSEVPGVGPEVFAAEYAPLGQNHFVIFKKLNSETDPLKAWLAYKPREQKEQEIWLGYKPEEEK